MRLIAEIAGAGDARRALKLGARGMRADATAMLRFDAAARRYLLATGGREKRDALDALTARFRRTCGALLDAAGGAELIVALGAEGPGAVLGDVPRAERVRATSGRLGVSGVRWVLADPHLFTALATGLFEAAAERALVPAVLFPAVSTGEELRAAIALGEAARADVTEELGLPLEVSYVAGVSTARGTGTVRSARVEYDAAAVVETFTAIAHEDAPRFLPAMVERGIFARDPFEETDALLAATLTGLAGTRDLAWRAGRPPTSREHALLDEAGVTALVLPASALPFDAPLAGLPRGSRRVRRPPPRWTALGESKDLDALVADVDRGELGPRDALLAVSPSVADTIARPRLETRGAEPASIGLGASPGAGCGRVALSAEHAARLRADHQPYVLVVTEVFGEEGFAVRSAQGLVSVRGGRTSHAALMAANAGVPCVVDETLRIDLATRTATAGHAVLHEGDWISIDGGSGEIFARALPCVTTAGPSFARLLSWADEARRLRVYVNADRPEDARAAILAGAEGVGLVRTENLLLDPDLLVPLRAALLGDLRRLEALERGQRALYASWLSAVSPVTFRLLDAPPSELLPRDRDGAVQLARALDLPLDEVARRIDAEQPAEPALSLRAARLALVRPEIERAQVRALAGAWLDVRPSGPLRMIVPLVCGGEELRLAAARIRAAIAELGEVPLQLGAMMETPRAALDAAAIAAGADFLAWGSNDLTQLSLGLGRDAAAAVVPALREARALDADPHQTLDLDGPGALIEMAESAARAVRPSLVTGVCGNLAADPRSIAFFHRAGLSYVSVPPNLVARARIAAAQAALQSS